MQVDALGYMPVVVACSTAMQENPAGCRYAQFPGHADAGHDKRRGLVDEYIGIHQARVWETDPAIVIIDVSQLFPGDGLSSGRQRVVACDRSESDQQFRHRLQIFGHSVLALASNGILESWINSDCRASMM